MEPQNLRYTREHEWVRLSGTRAVVGITDYAQKEMGDIVFVELPPVGESVTAGGVMATLESVKAVSDVYAPLSGEVVEANTQLQERPELINEDPYGEGWLVVIEPADLKEGEGLLTAAEYQEYLESEE